MATKRKGAGKVAAASKRAVARSSNAEKSTGCVGQGEWRGTAKMGSAVISGCNFSRKAVTFYDVEGIAIIEGDIAIGTVADVTRATDEGRVAIAPDPNIAFGVGRTGNEFRWPNCRMPYEIDPNLPNQSRVTDAIAHWEANTNFRFPLRTAANAAQYPNYVRFTDAGGCWSMVGMQGGQQTISLGTGCSTGNTIHEIGHAVGLWHEQSREDRDLFVTIHWENIETGMAAQFNQHITDGDDLGAYDYGSIMHYPRKAFSKNNNDTITPTDPTAQIGQRNGLSAGDIAAVREMYPACGTAPPGPGNFKKFADDGISFKKIRDDHRPFKKFRDDPIKGWRDPKLPRDPGPIKMQLDPMPGTRPEIFTRPGGIQPFSLAAPHHAPGFGLDQTTATGSAAGNYVAVLEQQILDLQAAIADAEASATHAHADIGRLQTALAAVTAAYEQALTDLQGRS